MPAEQEIQTIVARAKQLLFEARAKGINLNLDTFTFNDEWLYLLVSPAQEGERASKHAHLMTEIERKLRGEGFNQVLLVPVVPEHAG